MSEAELISNLECLRHNLSDPSELLGVDEAISVMKRGVRHYCPWGHYEVLAEGPSYKVKRLVIDPGKRTSLQWHEKRIENWEVCGGDEWTIECQFRMKKGPGRSTVLEENQVLTHVDIRELHRIHNIGGEPLVIIEIQRFLEDDPSTEEDVHRMEDDYNRICGEWIEWGRVE